MRSASSAQALRELAYELMRRIEYELGEIDEGNGADIAATIAECERTLAEIKTHVADSP